MKKSTRALTGMVLLDGIVGSGAAWMVWQIQSGAWNAPDPAAAVAYISKTAGGIIAVITGVLVVAYFVHRRRGN
jgi:Na+/glutamate symporter